MQSLGFMAVWLSPLDPKERYGLGGASIRDGWEEQGAKENKREKEVEPNGHGEGTHGHELHLHELASINPTMVIPLSVFYRLHHNRLIVCG